MLDGAKFQLVFYGSIGGIGRTRELASVRCFAVRHAGEPSRLESHQNHDVAASRRGLPVPLWNSALTVEERAAWMRASFGTSLERIAAESLTRQQFEFVHGDMSRYIIEAIQDRVAA